jgi:hypothetical protein
MGIMPATYGVPPLHLWLQMHNVASVVGVCVGADMHPCGAYCGGQHEACYENAALLWVLWRMDSRIMEHLGVMLDRT